MRYAVSKNDAVCGFWPILYSVYGFYPILNAVCGFWSFLNAVCGIGKTKEVLKRPATIPLSTFHSFIIDGFGDNFNVMESKFSMEERDYCCY